MFSGHDQADEIYAKDKEKAANIHAPAWIPCSSTMPKGRRHVLVWCPNILCTFTASFDDGEWRCAFGHDLLRHIEITHWMPLPPPPLQSNP